MSDTDPHLTDEHGRYSDEYLSQIHPLAVPFLFLGRESFKRKFMWLPIIGLIISVGLGFVYTPKHLEPWHFFGSWAVIGFLSYTFVVLAAEPLFKLLARGEDYYDDGTGAQDAMHHPHGPDLSAPKSKTKQDADLEGLNDV